MRPEQWVKNCFIFLPLIFGKKLFVFPDNLKSVMAFIIFCIVSGAAYLVNDIIDIEKDKLHPSKRLRPIASGKVSLRLAAISAFILGGVSVALSFTLNLYFGYAVTFYILLNFVYSKILKDAVIIDVFCLGAFFLLRILAGCAAIGLRESRWIMIMITLLALFLGFNKRRQELKLFETKDIRSRSVLAEYNPWFIDQMITVVTSSLVIAFMLYTVDAKTVAKFGTDHLMYGLPFVYYGIFRYLYLIDKSKRSEDPAHILLSDVPMQLNIALWLAVSVAVIYFGL